MKFLVALFAVAALSGCGKDPESVSDTTNSAVKVERLFTHDGVTVYRFFDYGRAVYFTSRGNATATRAEYCGKGCYREEKTQTLAFGE